MDKDKAKKRIEKLKKLIEKYRYAYHVLDKPLASDAVNDSLKHELQDLENKFPQFITPDSPTQRVGGEPLKQFQKVVHRAPMLSLTDNFSLKENLEWEKRNEKMLDRKPNSYFAEMKIDGLAVALHYQNGVFTQGLTRGDGKVGEDVTDNLKTIESIPLHINADLSFEARGEVYMKNDVFNKLNKTYKKQGKPILANPRNGAAGSVRQLNPRLASERKLSFMGYDILLNEKIINQNEELRLKIQNLKTHKDKHKLLKQLGFVVAEGKECKDLNEVQKFYESVDKKRDKLDFQIDGVWIGVDSNTDFEKLGVVGKAPRGAIAYKFPAQEKTTILKDIINQIGRTGRITPVAIMEPVNLAGTTVTRATLHNWEEIEKKDIRVGDTIIVRKAGDIIPEVVKSISELRSAQSKKLIAPKECPNCYKPLQKRKADQIDLYCLDTSCGQTKIKQLIHFVSKKAFDIDGLGRKIIEQLYSVGLVKDEADIFKLKQSDLAPLERFAEKSSQNIIDAIQRAKEITLARFIFSLGILHIGEVASSSIALDFSSGKKIIVPYEFCQAIKLRSQDEWMMIRDFGPEGARALYLYFQKPENAKKMIDLTKLGIKLKLPDKKLQTLKNKTFVLTGELETFTRETAENEIRLRGGLASSSISKDTDFLVVGKNPGSKLAKAQKLNAKIISEKELLKLFK